MPAHWLEVIKEEAYGTLKSSITDVVDQGYINLYESNSFAGNAVPVFNDVPYGGGFDVIREAVSDHYETTFRISTLLYPTQTSLLLGWALTRINSGQTSPWTTTEPQYDLASMGMFEGVRTRSGTIIRRKFPGCKVRRLQIQCSRQDPRCRITIDGIAQKEIPNADDSAPDGTAAPAPAESEYPSGPWLFSHTAGVINIGGSTISSYDSISLTIENTLSAQAFESNWLTMCGAYGRRATLEVSGLLKTSPDFRDRLLSKTAQDVTLEFDNGTNQVVFDLHPSNSIRMAPFNLDLGREARQTITIQSVWNGTDAADVDFSYGASS